jgi:hypothetical protein
MVMILLIGFLLILGISLMVLDATIDRADEGFEDNSGFHQESHQWTPESELCEEITLWDQMDGACCSLEMRPHFRPIVSTQFDHHS